MLQKIYYSFLFLIFTFTNLSAQPQNYFIQHEANTLKLQNKNDLLLAGGIMRKGLIQQYFITDRLDYTYYLSKKVYQIQIAYSPIKHLGLFGIHSFLKYNQFGNRSNIFHQSNNTGGGIGSYYSFKFSQRPLYKMKKRQKMKYDIFLFDFYAGYTFGKTENQYSSVVGNNSFNFQKIYGQLGFHWKSGSLGISYVFKKGITNYYQGKINGQTSDHDEIIQTIINTDKIHFQESTFKLDYEKKRIKYYLQITFASNRELNYFGTIDRLSHIGVVFDIQKTRTHLFKKNRKK